MSGEPKTPNQIIEQLKAENRAAVDAAFAAGQASMQQPEQFEFSNGQVESARGSAYEDELRVVVSKLRAEGVRRIKDHPDVLRVKSAHGR